MFLAFVPYYSINLGSEAHGLEAITVGYEKTEANNQISAQPSTKPPAPGTCAQLRPSLGEATRLDPSCDLSRGGASGEGLEGREALWNRMGPTSLASWVFDSARNGEAGQQVWEGSTYGLQD